MTYFLSTAPDEPFDRHPRGAHDHVELEHSELDWRLRKLSWPAPPAEVRERCYEAVLLRAGLLGACPPAPAVHPQPPARDLRSAGQVERYETTRRRVESPALRVAFAPRRELRLALAPRRAPRLASVL